MIHCHHVIFWMQLIAPRAYPHSLSTCIPLQTNKMIMAKAISDTTESDGLWWWTYYKLSTHKDLARTKGWVFVPIPCHSSVSLASGYQISQQICNSLTSETSRKEGRTSLFTLMKNQEIKSFSKANKSMLALQTYLRLSRFYMKVLTPIWENKLLQTIWI